MSPHHMFIYSRYIFTGILVLKIILPIKRLHFLIFANLATETLFFSCSCNGKEFPQNMFKSKLIVNPNGRRMHNTVYVLYFPWKTLIFLQVYNYEHMWNFSWWKRGHACLSNPLTRCVVDVSHTKSCYTSCIRYCNYSNTFADFSALNIM